MAITALTQSNNPFDVAHTAMLEALAKLPVPKPLVSYPHHDDFLAVRDYLRGVGGIVDQAIVCLGHQIKHVAECRVDMSQFEGVLTGAIDGNATYEIENAAACVAIEEELEMAS